MTAKTKIDAIEWLRKQLENAPDGLRATLGEMAQILMEADADAACGRELGRAQRRADELA